MFLVFTLVLLIVAIGILVSVYSVFFPFMQNLWTVQNYHMAYYGAVSAVERAELWLRYRSPWFVWSWGFLGSTWFGPLSDYTPDLLPGYNRGFVRNIDSRTTRIPSPGMGTTDPMFSDPNDDSNDYNALWYTYLETLVLEYDDTTNPEVYYSWWLHLSSFSAGEITGIFRLPPKIHTIFWNTPWLLCDSYVGNNCDPDGDGIFDDIAVSRSIEGLYNGNGFKIFPTVSIFYYSGMQIDEPNDNAIRESIINNTGMLAFTTSFTPVAPHGSHLTKHTVVGQDSDLIEWQPFSQIFQSPTFFSWLRLLFGAANLFRTFTGAIYPYLEYQFTFPQEVADRFYTVEGNGRAGEYDVHIVLKKPTVQWTVGWDFTVIF